VFNEDGKIAKVYNLLKCFENFGHSPVKWKITTIRNKCLILVKSNEVNNLNVLTLSIQKHLVLLNKENNNKKERRRANKQLQCLWQFQG